MEDFVSSFIKKFHTRPSYDKKVKLLFEDYEEVVRKGRQLDHFAKMLLDRWINITDDDERLILLQEEMLSKYIDPMLTMQEDMIVRLEEMRNETEKHRLMSRKHQIELIMINMNILVNKASEFVSACLTEQKRLPKGLFFECNVFGKYSVYRFHFRPPPGLSAFDDATIDQI